MAAAKDGTHTSSVFGSALNLGGAIFGGGGLFGGGGSSSSSATASAGDFDVKARIEGNKQRRLEEM